MASEDVASLVEYCMLTGFFFLLPTISFNDCAGKNRCGNARFVAACRKRAALTNRTQSRSLPWQGAMLWCRFSLIWPLIRAFSNNLI